MKKDNDLSNRVHDLEFEVRRLRNALLAVSAWIAQSAVGVLTAKDVEALEILVKPKK